jgi:hypothetical protein
LSRDLNLGAPSTDQDHEHLGGSKYGRKGAPRPLGYTKDARNLRRPQRYQITPAFPTAGIYRRGDTLAEKKKGVDTPKDHNSRNHINVLTAKAVIGLPGGKGALPEIELAVEHQCPCVTFLDNEDQIEGLLESELRDKVQNVDEAKLDKFLKAVLKAPKV